MNINQIIDIFESKDKMNHEEFELYSKLIQAEALMDLSNNFERFVNLLEDIDGKATS